MKILKPSIFNQLFENADGERYAFSGSKGSLSKISNDETWGYLSGTTKDIPGCVESLVATGLVTPEGPNELDALITHNRKKIENSPLALQIAPTLACNFMCEGCIQGSTHRGAVMSEETQDALLSFAESTRRDLSIGWYGGEPTLAIKAISRMTSKFLALSEKTGVTYSASMTTNGYLVTEDIARVLIEELKIQRFQVTLDGLEEEHNRRRPMADGGMTFSQVLSGIKFLHGNGATVKVRINIDNNNWGQVPDLLDLLKREGLCEVLLTAGMKHGCSSDCDLMSMAEFAETFVAFQRLLYDNGFTRAANEHLPRPITNSCMMTNPHAYAIGPKGDICKCIDQIGDPSGIIGNVHDGAILNHSCEDFPKSDSICVSCSCLPICMGGCPLRNNGPQECNSIWRSSAIKVLQEFVENRMSAESR